MNLRNTLSDIFSALYLILLIILVIIFWGKTWEAESELDEEGL
jgi:hypothetical protein